MTTTTKTIIEFTPAQIAHRETCAFLKGIICGHADRCGHPYHTTKERTEAFDAGFKIGCEGCFGRGAITAIHIIHNRPRHRRPHVNEEYDAAHTGWTAKNLIEKHLGKETFALAMEQAELDKEAANEG